MAKTTLEKIWDEHVVLDHGDGQALLFVDRISLHERSGGRMLQGVLDNGREVARPDLVFGVLDHIIDTDPGRTDQTKFPGGAEFISVFREYAERAGIPVYDIGDDRQGIAHVVAAEQGFALPGTTFVCGDSHTCTLGGLGALAWGIGVTQGEHALATQTARTRRPDTMRVQVEGGLAAGVVAKDLILALIGAYGANGGQNAAIEFAGPAVRALGIEARMTLCNMAVEFGAWTGLVSADDATFEYLSGRPQAPRGSAWDAAVAHWRSLASDADASFQHELVIDAAALDPQVTWGTSPEHVIGISETVPRPAAAANALARSSMEKALAYTGVRPGMAIEGLPIEAAFIGSCTNSRLSDLRAAARILEGRRVAKGVRAICVPGSTQVRQAAEAEGLDRIFRDAGFEWRESGCSLCFYAGGDDFGGATRVISSTNRNFENRQGPGVRSHLASPATVAASAVAGTIADPRKLEA